MKLVGRTAIVTGSTKGIASDESTYVTGYVTGAVLMVDGDWSAYGYL